MNAWNGLKLMYVLPTNSRKIFFEMRKCSIVITLALILYVWSQKGEAYQTIPLDERQPKMVWAVFSLYVTSRVGVSNSKQNVEAYCNNFNKHQHLFVNLCAQKNPVFHSSMTTYKSVHLASLLISRGLTFTRYRLARTLVGA